MRVLQITILERDAVKLNKPPGYVDEIKAAATSVVGNNVFLTEEAYAALRRKFSPEKPDLMTASRALEQVTNTATKCTFPGCEDLRAGFQAELEAMGGENCSNCERGALLRKYSDKVNEVLQTQAPQS